MAIDNELKEKVLHQLNIGQDKALTGALLMSRLGLKNTRAIRLAIIDLIEDGHPIIGDSKGYYLAGTRKECEKALDTLRNSYGVMLFRHYKYLRIAMKSKFDGQKEMVFTGQSQMKF